MTPRQRGGLTNLLDKMRIVVGSGKRAELTEDPRRSHFSFYIEYSYLVSNALRRPLFQKFLKRVMRREKIGEHKIKDVQIRVFPSLGKNGKGLAGKCNSRGRICIFPKKRKFLRKRTQEQGKADAKLYIKKRARAALIHELLHLKYLSDEKRVRELTKKYLKTLTRAQRLQSQNVHDNT